MLRKFMLLILVAEIGLLTVSAESSPAGPVKVIYFYKVKWGYQQEFLDLYKRNHYPVMAAQVKTGRLLSVETHVPRFHGDGRNDWTFISILVFKDWQAMEDNSDEERVIRELYPDQDKFRREEQRRFELLEAHWDVPLRAAPMR